mmetsp:Transcript_4904/g.11608  ORF Transcript_4904/g.11608 Transcript_4904/m.11608 type:complete len:232 (-) Transcript_4904:1098-1793(-)
MKPAFSAFSQLGVSQFRTQIDSGTDGAMLMNVVRSSKDASAKTPRCLWRTKRRMNVITTKLFVNSAATIPTCCSKCRNRSKSTAGASLTRKRNSTHARSSKPISRGRTTSRTSRNERPVIDREFRRNSGTTRFALTSKALHASSGRAHCSTSCSSSARCNAASTMSLRSASTLQYALAKENFSIWSPNSEKVRPHARSSAKSHKSNAEDNVPEMTDSTSVSGSCDALQTKK